MTHKPPQDPTPATKLPHPVTDGRPVALPFRSLPHDTSRFDLGFVCITTNALTTIPLAEVGAALLRHACGDWTELSRHERESNEQALVEGRPIASFYTTQAGKHFWVLTEADRSATTVMVPFDY